MAVLESKDKNELNGQLPDSGSAAVQRQLNFAGSLADLYSWDEADKKELDGTLGWVRTRLQTSHLFLGVTGETSSGKSTFINALLRDDLLKAGILQATTSAITQITHGKYLNAEIELQDGRRLLFSKHGLSLWERFVRWLIPDSMRWRPKFLHFLHQYTADEETARQIKTVFVYHPNVLHHDGLVIVDTPGINSTNARHTSVAEAAVSEVCDAALVLIPATVPASAVLLDFLRTNLQGNLHRCIFLVTKIDLIRPKDRYHLLQTIQARLRNELAIENPLVLAVAPLEMLNELNPVKTDEAGGDQSELIEQYKVVEARIFEFVKLGRNLMVMQRLLDCFSKLFRKLQNSLNERLENFITRKKHLAENQIPDLEGFTKKKQDDYYQRFQRQAETIMAWPHEIIGQLEKDTLQTIENAVWAARDRDELRKLLETGVLQHIRSVQRALQKIAQDLAGNINEASVAHHDQFVKEFTAIYRSLGPLSQGVALPSYNPASLVFHIPGDLSQKPENMILSSKDGLLRYAWSRLTGPKLPELKSDACSHCRGNVGYFFTGCKQAVKQALGEHTVQTANALTNSINQYFLFYRDQVKAMISKMEAEQVALGQDTEYTEHVLNLLESQISEIEKDKSAHQSEIAG